MLSFPSHLFKCHLRDWKVGVRDSPRKPFAHQECSAAEQRSGATRCRAGLDENTQEAVMLWVSFRESREPFQTVHITHNETIAMCWRGLVYGVLSHVICWLESSLGQGNYNWCPGTHSSLCLKMSLTYKQVLTGDLLCEYLFHVGCKEKHTCTHIITWQWMHFNLDITAWPG